MPNLAHKTLGKFQYYENTGKEYELPSTWEVNTQEDIIVCLKTKDEILENENYQNYKIIANYNQYTITKTESSTKLVFTDDTLYATIIGIKVILPYNDIILESSNNPTSDNFKKDLVALRDRVDEILIDLENRATFDEDIYGDTVKPQYIENHVVTMQNGKISLRDLSNFLTWKDAGMVNERTTLYKLVFAISPGQTVINTQLEEIPQSDLIYIDKFLGKPASSAALTDGDFFVYLNATSGFMEIAINDYNKNTEFTLFYNIVTEVKVLESSGGGGEGGGGETTVNVDFDIKNNITDLNITLPRTIQDFVGLMPINTIVISKVLKSQISDLPTNDGKISLTKVDNATIICTFYDGTTSSVYQGYFQGTTFNSWQLIAKKSDLDNKFDKSGGTLTGPLNGPSGSFSGSLTAGSFTTGGEISGSKVRNAVWN